MRFNKKILFFYICVFIILFIASTNNYLDLNVIKNNEFNFITINTVFAGFLFTSLGIIAGFSSNSALNKFERIKTMDSIYLNIILGICFSLISIIISICKVIFIFDVTIIWINKLIDMIQIYFMFLTIIQFIISVKCTYFAISVVRLDIKKNFPSKESIKETLDKIK
ncbi:hypothetical protein [uncultured Clostridium sp.]|uniref:hypothetical protein n=1 Tax=uncultured Clostridium sp. TaxID=59620 RepID=UPI00258CD00A|nr:hypothetical protein [uncultured Clostridium sp.]